MALISICGSQGQGKTTVLTSLGELGYNVIPHKTSRLILTEWGCTLTEVHADPALTKKFQDECLVRHRENNIIALNSNEIYFTERSYADIFAYTIFALGSFNEYSAWLDDYYERCKEGQKMYSSVILLSGNRTNIEDDGVRSVNKHFSNAVDTILNYYIQDFGVPVLEIKSSIHEERIKAIINLIQSTR